MKTNCSGENISSKNCICSLIERSKIGSVIIWISFFLVFKIFLKPKKLILMITYPTFDHSIRLHIQFFDEKFSPEQFVFILALLSL